MPILFLTADTVGAPTGGGKVTQEELTALRTLGFVHTVQPRPDLVDPFQQDQDCEYKVRNNFFHTFGDDKAKLAHVYAGCFSNTVYALKSAGYTVTYTVAAHDVQRSRQAHTELGLPFPYPHLTDPELFRSYTMGYIGCQGRPAADVVIVPGKAPERVVRSQGRTGRIEIIPHGCDMRCKECEGSRIVPANYGNYVDNCLVCWGTGFHRIAEASVTPFVFGYLGAVGPDKGLLTLARAWADYASTPEGIGACLRIGGRYAKNARVLFQHSPGSVLFSDWYDDVSTFYKGISCYVQPAATEGFGIEVLEAMSYGVPTLCSDQAGACDLVPDGWSFRAGDYKELSHKMYLARTVTERALLANADWFSWWQERAKPYSWDRIRERYVTLWRSLLEGK